MEADPRGDNAGRVHLARASMTLAFGRRLVCNVGETPVPSRGDESRDHSLSPWRSTPIHAAIATAAQRALGTRTRRDGETSPFSAAVLRIMLASTD